MRQEGKDYDHRGHIADWCCPFLWQRMVILSDGNIVPCLLHGVPDFTDFIIGNVKDMNVKEAWNGEKMNYFRKYNQIGESHKIDACDQCSYRAMELEKLDLI